MRVIGPRLTVSIQTVARSTPGAAGRSLDTPTEISTIARRPAMPYMIWRIFFLRLTSGERAMSTIYLPLHWSR